jgi:hypothetical protein
MDKLFVGVGAIVALVIGGGVWNVAAWENTHTTQTCTVQQKDRTATSKGGSDVRIYTTNCGVLTVADDFLQGRWNSADVYSQIQTGHKYTFETIGWRNGLFSQFPNIIGVK